MSRNGKDLRGCNFQEDAANCKPMQEQNLITLQTSRRQLLIGSKAILNVRVIQTDGSFNFTTQTGLSDIVFGNGNDLHNLKSQYAACLYDRLIFNKSPNSLNAIFYLK